MINVKQAVDEAVDAVEARRKAVRATLDETDFPGLEAVDDQTFMAFVEAMVGQYPEEPMITPDYAEEVPPEGVLLPSPYGMIVVDGEGTPILKDGLPQVIPQESVIVASPWMVAMSYVDGGKQIVDRAIRIQRKGGA